VTTKSIFLLTFTQFYVTQCKYQSIINVRLHYFLYYWWSENYTIYSQTQKMNIAILSRNPALYSTQSLVNAARKRNHYVRVFDHMQCDLIIEENRPCIYYHGQRIKNIQAVIPRIGNSATTFGSAVIRQFELMKTFTTLKADPLLKARDKISCMQILAANGIAVPKSTLSNNIMSLSQMIDEVGPMPIVIKLVNGTHGQSSKPFIRPNKKYFCNLL